MCCDCDMWHVRKINMCGNSVISKWLSVWHCDRVGDGLVVSVYKCNVMVQLCRIICVIISVLSRYLPGIPVSAIWAGSLDRVSTLWLLTPTRDWHWQEIVVKIIPLSPLFSDSDRAIITSFLELLRGVFIKAIFTPSLLSSLSSQWLFDKETQSQHELEVWGAESWHLMISSFWRDPGNWLNLFQIIKTHNGKCHATEESWGAFTGLSPPI